MRTAKEMWEWCEKHKHTGTWGLWSKKHLDIVEKNLKPDEQVLEVFIGLHNYESMGKHDSNFAYAITGDRIIMGQKKMIGQVVHIVELGNVKDVRLETGLLTGILKFDTLTGPFSIAVESTVAKSILSRIHELVLKGKKSGGSSTGSSNMATELRELKQLLDDGIITKKDFESKKAKLLGT